MNQDFLFFDASQYSSALRCTIQKTGKLGFSDFTQTKLGLNEKMSIRIGVDGTKDSYTHLLLQLIETVEPSAFKIYRAGKYFYINAKPLFDELGLPYKTRNIMFEMTSLNEEKNIYKLTKKEVKVDTT
jgi:hypothetical protein